MNYFGVISLLAVISVVTASGGVKCKNQPKRIRWTSCCPYGNIISPKVEKTCMSKFLATNKDKTEKPIPNACLFECYISEMGIMNGDTLNVGKLKKYLESGLKKLKSMHAVMHKAFLTCSQKLAKLHAEMKKHPPGFPKPDSKSCKQCAGALLNCVQKEIIFNCPANVWKNDAKCNAHKKFYKTCKPPMTPHLH